MAFGVVPIEESSESIVPTDCCDCVYDTDRKAFAYANSISDSGEDRCGECN